MLREVSEGLMGIISDESSIASVTPTVDHTRVPQSAEIHSRQFETSCMTKNSSIRDGGVRTEDYEVKESVRDDVAETGVHSKSGESMQNSDRDVGEEEGEEGTDGDAYSEEEYDDEFDAEGDAEDGEGAKEGSREASNAPEAIPNISPGSADAKDRRSQGDVECNDEGSARYHLPEGKIASDATKKISKPIMGKKLTDGQPCDGFRVDNSPNRITGVPNITEVPLYLVGGAEVSTQQKQHLQAEHTIWLTTCVAVLVTPCNLESPLLDLSFWGKMCSVKDYRLPEQPFLMPGIRITSARHLFDVFIDDLSHPGRVFIDISIQYFPHYISRIYRPPLFKSGGRVRDDSWSSDGTPTHRSPRPEVLRAVVLIGGSQGIVFSAAEGSTIEESHTTCKTASNT